MLECRLAADTQVARRGVSIEPGIREERVHPLRRSLDALGDAGVDLVHGPLEAVGLFGIVGMGGLLGCDGGIGLVCGFRGPSVGRFVRNPDLSRASGDFLCRRTRFESFAWGSPSAHALVVLTKTGRHGAFGELIGRIILPASLVGLRPVAGHSDPSRPGIHWRLPGRRKPLPSVFSGGRGRQQDGHKHTGRRPSRPRYRARRPCRMSDCHRGVRSISGHWERC